MFIFHSVVHETDELTSDISDQQDILIIREADLEDARAFIRLQETIFSETDFMLYGKSDIQMTVQSIRKEMHAWKNSTNSNLLLAIMNGQFAGYLYYYWWTKPTCITPSFYIYWCKTRILQKGNCYFSYASWREIGQKKLEYLN